MDQVQTPKLRGRGCLLWLAALVVGLLFLALAGFIYESLSESADLRSYPPPGQLVDVGGYRLHIYCTGNGSPTVVIDAGLGDWSPMWGFVQAEVAKTTRVCTYDRAGMGWSDAGPLPRDAAQLSKELHALLQQAKIPGPYVLVGHSFGGFPVRIYTHDYPSEVAGVVLAESMSPAQFKQSPPDATSQAALQSHAFSIFTVLARLGVVRLLVKPLGIVPYELSAEKAYLAYFVRPQNMQVFTDESQAMPASAAEADAIKTFGNLPLIVLTCGLDQETEWQTMQTNLLQLSSNSQQLIADQSGHNIEIDQPKAAAGAILKMVEQVR